MSAAIGAPRADSRRRWLQRITLGAILLGLAGAVLWGILHLSHGPDAPRRQVAHITILPDTPPPPPPPPPDVKRPQPKEELAKQQVAAPKQETPPEPAPLKMEGATGDGPSQFAAGEVKQEYIGGEIGNGSRYAAYVARLEQEIQTELSRRKLRINGVKLFVWLLPDGSIQRISVSGGGADAEQSVKTAIAELNHVSEAPLADMPMPIGLQISVR